MHLAAQEQLLTTTRTRHPALRKTAAITDEAIDDENITSDSHNWNTTNGVTSFASTKRSNQPTATIVCTKSEPLSGEDISGVTVVHHRSTLPVHAHSVPPMRLSKLHDMSAMNTVIFDFGTEIRSCDGNFAEETNGSLSDAPSVIKHQISSDPSGLSTTYCRDTGVTLPLNSHLMPPKSVIQDDIRMKLGRFELVKKKGRSEVWNLFGQVLDTITGARLPYVACYACKVLYTDTGGGTGNMTRHRCPIGSSYKDNSINSTETANDSSGQQSFETLTSGYVNQLSPDTSGAYRRESPAPPSVSHTSLTTQSSFETSFTDYDRRVFCNAIMRCCAIDLLPPAIFQGDGMHGIIETAISIGRRCRCPDRQAISTLIPETSTLNQVIEANTSMVLSELTAEVGQIARTSGFSFSVERIVNEDDIAVVSANYITAEWKYKHRIVNVDTVDKMKTGLGTIIREAGESKRLLCVTENIPSCGGQAHLYCICYTLNNLIHEIFGELRDQKCDVFAIFVNCQKIVAAIEKLGLDRWANSPVEKRAGRFDYLFYGYEMLKYVKDCVEHLTVAQNPDIMVLVRSIDWSVADEIRKYLEPFHIMASIFIDKSAVSFHMVQPEWFALIHEFSSDDEDNVSKNDVGSWVCSLRRKTENILRNATESVIMPEHRMATVLNPRLKHLPVICSDEQRMETYSRIRKLIGASEMKLKSEELLAGTSDGEPPKKRVSFLSSLEDHAVIDDELECYLRSQYPASQTKDVLLFWSTVGQAQFPHLSLLARFLLSIPAACVVHNSQNVLKLTPECLSSLLLLRSSYAQTASSEQSIERFFHHLSLIMVEFVLVFCDKYFVRYSMSKELMDFPLTRSCKYLVQDASVSKVQVMDRKAPLINKQNFDYFLLLDFEATCEEGIKIMPHQEIIEFPVIQLSAKNFEEVRRFHRYVRPTERPILTSFCTDLTGIVQETVANEETLPDVLNAFNKWLIEANLINADHSMKSFFTFITCGDWDLGVLLPNEANYRNLVLPDYFNRWINLKKAFCKCRGYFAKSLTVMLRDLGLNHVGRLHSGVDDVRNMCQITKCLAMSGYVFQNTSIYVDAKRSFENL
ncbi:unnamed protein product [Litomosoides sigmodontis]|uniref:BED-type domain-containing protein n=1 Tax=Litomosoides sigmodontis TaxID=42156 RepID=A0A3P6U3T7_LITSI|nr:unnamed protein product [Litomosoides sigmodontis]